MTVTTLLYDMMNANFVFIVILYVIAGHGESKACNWMFRIAVAVEIVMIVAAFLIK